MLAIDLLQLVFGLISVKPVKLSNNKVEVESLPEEKLLCFFWLEEDGFWKKIYQEEWAESSLIV